MTEDTSDLKARVDLAWLVGRELGPPQKRNRRWLFWPCPFHNDTNPSFGVTSDDGRWKCFGACGDIGDHFDFLQKRHGLSFTEAKAELQRLAGLPDARRAPETTRNAQQVDDPPSDRWQARARAFSSWAAEQLWTDAGAPGLAYLRGGGLTDDTIRAWGLGWCAGGPGGRPLHEGGERWGLDAQPVYMARGVTIPCHVAGVLWYVKIRRFDANGQPEGDHGKKYGCPRGSKTALFGADRFQGGRPLLVCEGERDTMLAWQELGDLVDVATLGGAGKRSLGRWALWLLSYRQILAAYDADESGRNGAAWWADLSQRVTAASVPEGNDLTDFHAAGGNLREWLQAATKHANLDARLDRVADALDDQARRIGQLEETRAFVAELKAQGIPCDGYPSWDAWLEEVEAEG